MSSLMGLGSPSLSTRAEGVGGLLQAFPMGRPVLVLPLPILLHLLLLPLNHLFVRAACPIVPLFGVLLQDGSGPLNDVLLVGCLPPHTIQMFC